MTRKKRLEHGDSLFLTLKVNPYVRGWKCSSIEKIRLLTLIKGKNSPTAGTEEGARYNRGHRQKKIFGFVHVAHHARKKIPHTRGNSRRKVLLQTGESVGEKKSGMTDFYRRHWQRIRPIWRKIFERGFKIRNKFYRRCSI